MDVLFTNVGFPTVEPTPSQITSKWWGRGGVCRPRTVYQSIRQLCHRVIFYNLLLSLCMNTNENTLFLSHISRALSSHRATCLWSSPLYPICTYNEWLSTKVIYDCVNLYIPLQGQYTTLVPWKK